MQCNSIPGAGACGGMYTANIMASAIEAMGMCLPYSSSVSAEDPLKLDECRLAGKHLLELLKIDLKPRDIITHDSLRNAMVVVKALGGSTDVMLHLIAIARSVGLELTLDDFQKVCDEVSFLAELKPSDKYFMEVVHKAGGTPDVIRYLLELGYLDGDCMTVTGKTMAENVQSYSRLPDRQGNVPKGMSEMLTGASEIMGAVLRKAIRVVFYAVKFLPNLAVQISVKLLVKVLNLNPITKLITEKVTNIVAPLAINSVSPLAKKLAMMPIKMGAIPMSPLLAVLVEWLAIDVVEWSLKKLVTKLVTKLVSPIAEYLVGWLAAYLIEWMVRKWIKYDDLCHPSRHLVLNCFFDLGFWFWFRGGKAFRIRFRQ